MAANKVKIEGSDLAIMPSGVDAAHPISVSRGGTTKTPASVQDWTAVAQNAIVVSPAYDLSSVYKAILHIQAALDATDAHTGTRFIVEISSSASGNEDWYPLTDFVALIGTAKTDATENALDIDDTDITLTGHLLTVEGVLLFIEESTLANSEIVREASQSTNQIVLLSGVSNTHIVGTDIFDIAMAMNITLPESANRVRVVVDNSYDDSGSTLDYKVQIGTVTGV